MPYPVLIVWIRMYNLKQGLGWGNWLNMGRALLFIFIGILGNSHYENIIITERREISRSDFVNGLINLKEDVLYIIRN